MSEELQYQSLPPVEFIAGGPNDEIKQANLEAVQPSPGYPSLVIMLADAITKRADIVLLDYQPGLTAIRYKVDGVWHSMPDMDRESSDFMLASLKRLANLDHLERVARQKSEFHATYLKHKHKCVFVSQGVKSGERVAIYVDREKPPTDSLENMGMRSSQREKLAECINRQGSLVVASAMPSEFFAPFWEGVLKTGDRFMRDFFMIYDAAKPNNEVINVTPVSYDTTKGETFQSTLRQVLLREPNVIALPEIDSSEQLDLLCDQIVQNEMTGIVRTEGRDVFDALLRLQVVKPDLQKLASTLSCVVNQRTIRMLCDYCRQPFAPNNQLLQQLGLPPNRIATLFTHFAPRPEDMIDEQGNPYELEPCPKCGGPGYFERTSIFEILIANDEIKKAVANGANRAELTKAAANADHISIRDEGVVLVAKGITSLEELRRVLKQ